MTSETELIIPDDAERASLTVVSFKTVAEFALSTVAPSSARTYGHTYELWQEWCARNRSIPLELRPLDVRDFLIAQPVTKSTRQRHLAALRKLARVMALDSTQPKYRSIYEALRLLRVPVQNLGGEERERRALNNTDVWEALRVWKGRKLIYKRNRALLAVLFYTGLRRSEAVVLRWEDIDLREGVVRVRHGKGDKRRDVAIVEGPDDTAVKALRTYQRALEQATGEDRQYIFCSINKADRPGKDRPVNVRAVNQIVEKTSAACGIDFTPHDARRTLGTDLLTNNHPTSDVQAQLGHAHASTTIQGYSMPADARKRRGRFKTTY
jgi:integrase